jgi:hypothetical protein
MTLNKGVFRYLRCPYQAKVINMFEIVSKITVVIELFIQARPQSSAH